MACLWDVLGTTAEFVRKYLTESEYALLLYDKHKPALVARQVQWTEALVRFCEQYNSIDLYELCVYMIQHDRELFLRHAFCLDTEKGRKTIICGAIMTHAPFWFWNELEKRYQVYSGLNDKVKFQLFQLARRRENMPAMDYMLTASDANYRRYLGD